MKTRLLSLFVCCTSLSAQLEVRDASHRPVEGYAESSYILDQKERTVYLGSEILLSSQDVASCSVVESGDAHAVRITFTDGGAEKFRRITENRIRKQLAFIIKGEVLSAPTIMDTLSKYAIITGFSKSKAEKVAEKILSHKGTN